ncbi:MAG: hypothetical protein U1F98_05360 [Verrucomicrobiota bacterium]
MKKMILAAMIAGVAGMGVQTARAGDGWCVAGQVLAGVGAAALVTSAIIHPQPCTTVSVYGGPAPVYGVSYGYYQPAPAPQVVYVPAPAPVIVAPAPVYYAPAPVYRPVVRAYYPPAPAVRVQFGGGCARPYPYYRCR